LSRWCQGIVLMSLLGYCECKNSTASKESKVNSSGSTFLFLMFVGAVVLGMAASYAILWTIMRISVKPPQTRDGAARKWYDIFRFGK